MVAGRLTEKNGYWHMILHLRKEGGKKGPKWFSTGLKVEGNKKLAEQMLIDLRLRYTRLEEMGGKASGCSFDEYMLIWLKGMRGKVTASTLKAYSGVVENSIVPYFKTLQIPLTQLKAHHLESYYDYLLSKGLSPNTVIRHHTNIHKALKEAMRKELIPGNPAALAEKPKKKKYITHPYTVEETNQLVECIRGDKNELLILTTIMYGLRRSEVLGLRWKAVDFDENTIIINHTVCREKHGGKTITIAEDRVKRTASLRTMPLMEPIKSMLLAHAKERYGGDVPSTDDYIFVDKRNRILKPDYVSRYFKTLLEEKGLRPIRLHDLRHGCAGILISDRVSLVEIQQWLGHAHISTTADMYIHMEYAMKEQSANSIKKTEITSV